MRAIILRVGLILLCVLLIQEPRQQNGLWAVAAGDQAAQERNFAEAVTYYQQALAFEPNNPGLLEKLVESATSAKRPELAAGYLQKLIELHGWTPANLRNLADLLAIQGEEQQAVAYWQASLTNAPGDVPVLRKMADYSLANRDWDRAAEWLRQLIALQPFATAQYQLALLTLTTDARSALDLLTQAATNDPGYQHNVDRIREIFSRYDDPVVLNFQLGLVLMELREWPFAERALISSLAQNVSNPAAMAMLGLAQDQQKRDGWPMINRALSAAPDDPMINYAAALHWRLAGDNQQAMASLMRAGSLDPTNPAIAAEVGTIYRLEGRLLEAARWLNVALAMAPDQATFRTLLATFYADENYNLSGEGLDTIRSLVERSPDDPDVHASLGWALFSTGQLNEARKELETALTLDSNNPRARYYYGIFLEYQNDLEGAVRAYLDVYQNSPDPTFKDLAMRGLNRLGYKSSLNNLIGNEAR